MKFLAINISEQNNNWALIDENLRVIDSDSFKTNHINIKLTFLIQEVKNLVEFVEKKHSEINCITLSIPGCVSSNNGQIIDNSRWMKIQKDINLNDEFKKKINKEFFFINDANASIIGSKMIGNARKFKNSIYLISKTGIGIGIMINEHFHYGSNFLAGEIGKIKNQGTTIEVNLSYKTILSKATLILGKNIETSDELFENINDDRILDLINNWFNSLIQLISDFIWYYDPELIEIESQIFLKEFFTEEKIKRQLNLDKNINLSIKKVNPYINFLPLIGSVKAYLLKNIKQLY